MAKATHTQEPAKKEEVVQAPEGFVIVTGTGKKDKYKDGKKYTLNAETADTLIAKGHVKK